MPPSSQKVLLDRATLNILPRAWIQLLTHLFSLISWYTSHPSCSNKSVSIRRAKTIPAWRSGKGTIPVIIHSDVWSSRSMCRLLRQHRAQPGVQGRLPGGGGEGITQRLKKRLFILRAWYESRHRWETAQREESPAGQAFIYSTDSKRLWWARLEPGSDNKAVNSYSPCSQEADTLIRYCGSTKREWGEVPKSLASHIQGPVCFFFLAFLPQWGPESHFLSFSVASAPALRRPWGMENSQEWGRGKGMGRSVAMW